MVVCICRKKTNATHCKIRAILLLFIVEREGVRNNAVIEVDDR